MGMPAMQERRWTAAEVRALPDEPGKRFEVVDGELLVSPGPTFRHQYVLSRLFAVLCPYVDGNRLGAVLWGPGEVELDDHTMVQPDLFVVRREEVKSLGDAQAVRDPMLLIEALSPSTARYDRVVKRGRYQRQRVEYWIVDFEARLVERWQPEASRPEIIADFLEWHPPQADRPLVIDLAVLFDAALGA